MTFDEVRVIVNIACKNVLDTSIELTSLAKASLVAEIEKQMKQEGILVSLSLDYVNLSMLYDLVWRSIPRKVLVCDLDETLWEGVIGEDGYDIIPNDDLQYKILELKNKGILLVICSHNDEQFARQILSLQTMPLSWDDFVAHRVGYGRKSDYIQEIAQELNLGLTSFVFMDDQAIQRDEVESRLPEVLCIHPDELGSLNCFNHEVTEEDFKRSDMYMAEKKRKAIMSMPDWLEQLEMKVRVRGLHIADILGVKRAVQLINKVNQFNLNPRKVTEEQFRVELLSKDFRCLVFDVSDKFGDYGIVGIVSIKQGKYREFKDFVLSCRAFGRGIENVMFIEGSSTGNGGFGFFCKETEFNKPARDFWKSVNASMIDYPSHIEVIYE